VTRHPPPLETQAQQSHADTIQSMPMSPARRCPHSGCTTLITTGKLCKEHSKQLTKQRNRRETWRDYGTAWRTIRAQVLLETPACAQCGALATEVDHVKPLRLGGTHDRSNLKALCKPCHSRKTQAETFPRS
jgi:5-methylcytosine-specific restriction protein A